MLTRLALAALFGTSVLAGTAHAVDYKLVNISSTTNTYAFVGVPASNALKLAAEQINASGMLGAGNKIVLINEDGASDRNQAITLVNKHGRDKDTLLIFGPTSTIDILAAGPASKEHSLPQMTNSPAPVLLKVSDYIFRASVATDEYMTTMANFGIKKGVKNCAYVTVNDNEGYLLQRDIVRDVMVKAGGTVVADETAKSSETNYSALATKIVDRKPQCLEINMPAANTANVIIQLRQAGLDPKTVILTSNSAASKAYLDIGGAAVEGTYMVSEFAAPGTTAMQKKFTEDYTKAFGSTPDNWAGIGYTQMQIVAAALKAAGPNPTRDQLRDAMLKTKDLPVVVGDGKLTITPDRLTHYEMAVLTVKDGKFVAP